MPVAWATGYQIPGTVKCNINEPGSRMSADMSATVYISMRNKRCMEDAWLCYRLCIYPCRPRRSSICHLRPLLLCFVRGHQVSCNSIICGALVPAPHKRLGVELLTLHCAIVPTRHGYIKSSSLQEVSGRSVLYDLQRFIGARCLFSHFRLGADCRGWLSIMFPRPYAALQ
jgi:hypothetical protein